MLLHSCWRDRRRRRAWSRSTPACCSRRRCRPGARSRSASACTIEVMDAAARARRGRGPALLRRRQGRRARARARRAPTRGSPGSVASRRPRARNAQLELDERRGDVEVQPARRLDRARTSGGTSTSTTCPTTRCTIRATRRSAAPPARSPGSGREGRWAGQDKTECGLHVEVIEPDVSVATSPTSCRISSPRGRVDPHLPRGGGRARAPGAAVQRRQGLDRPAAPGREGVPPGALPVPDHARRHRPQLPRGDRVPRPPRRPSSASA